VKEMAAYLRYVKPKYKIWAVYGTALEEIRSGAGIIPAPKLYACQPRFSFAIHNGRFP
jgi:hypothetical protein